MKEEMEEEPKHYETFESTQSQSEQFATQEREVEKSNKASISQAAAEPEPKPVAKRRRLTRRDMQQTMQTGGPSLSSVKTELAEGVKVKKEKGTELGVSFERQEKEEMDDLWLKVRKKVSEQLLVTFAAASSATENVLRPPESESGASPVQTSTQHQLEPSAFGMEDASKSKADEDCFWVRDMHLDCSGRIQTEIGMFGVVKHKHCSTIQRVKRHCSTSVSYKHSPFNSTTHAKGEETAVAFHVFFPVVCLP